MSPGRGRAGGAHPPLRWVFLATLLGAASPLPAQTIVGRVVDESTETPILGAIVSLVTFTGEVDAQTLADDEGGFRITPTRVGEYYLEAARLGYETGRTPLLMLEMEGTVPLDLARMLA